MYFSEISIGFPESLPSSFLRLLINNQNNNINVVYGHLMQTADSLEKTLMLGKDIGQKEKRVTQDEMFGWHH